MSYQEIITNYLLTVDESVERLSARDEGNLSNLPGWVLQKRKITIGITKDEEGVVIRVTPDGSLDEDEVTLVEISSINDINRIISPLSFEGGMPNNHQENAFITLGEITVIEARNPLAVPVLESNGLIGWGRSSGYKNIFGIEQAKVDAINFWNTAVEGLKNKQSYVQTVKKILDKFQAIIKRKGFLERRVHRYINEHKNIFLPEFKNCFFEHKLYLKEQVRIADFILEREQGLPSIFIELESPIHKVFTKKLDLTAEANHARQQVSEWVKYVENEPNNSSGEFAFLTGPKERMVIIGKGLEDRDALRDTKYDGVTFWTYSLMLEEAKNRMNQRLAAQYKMLGLNEIRPF